MDDNLGDETIDGDGDVTMDSSPAKKVTKVVAPAGDGKKKSASDMYQKASRLLKALVGSEI
jgi:hypothetical protein